MSNISMLVLLQIALFFSCSYAQEEEIFDQDDNIFLGDNFMDLSSGSGEEPSSENSNSNLEEILRELSAVLTNDLRHGISKIQVDMKDLKEKMADISDLKNEMKKMNENIVRNEAKIERNSAQITSVSEQQETMIVNNIQRLNFMDNKMADIKLKMVRNEEGEISKKFDTIFHMNSTISDVNLSIEEHSALINSMSEMVEQQQAMIENNVKGMDSITNTMAEMGGIKEKMENLEEKIVQNSDSIVDINSTAERNSAQINSVVETRIAVSNPTNSDIEDMKENILVNSYIISDVNSTLNAQLSSQLNLTNSNILKNEKKIKQMDSTIILLSQDMDRNKDYIEKEIRKVELIPGPRGEAGPPGSQGVRGEPGPSGNPGPEGERGIKGERGYPGPVGPEGSRGYPGQVGPKGNRGYPGSVGPKGNKGYPGPVGPKGNKGYPGSKGPKGNKGYPGGNGDYRTPVYVPPTTTRRPPRQGDKC